MNHHHDEDEMIAAEVQGIHQRLVADGDSWQHQLPSPDRYIDYFTALREQNHVENTASLHTDNITLVHNYERTPLQHARTRWIGIIAAITVTALLIMTFAFIQAHSTNAPAIRPLLHVTASQGWVHAKGIDFGKTIVFAAKDPLTGYVCGNTLTPPYTGKSAPIRLSVTRDGGLTWHELPTTPAQGVGCELSINPLNADDVIVIVYGITPPSPSYRSFNGGKTWKLLHFPTLGSGTNSVPDSFVWAGSALFVDIVHPGVQSSEPPLNLAVSVNGGAFTWADTNLVAPPNTVQRHEFAIGATLYIQYYVKPDYTTCGDPLKNQRCITGYSTFSKTSDNGATWTNITPSIVVYSFSFVLADGHTLLGEIDSPYKDVPGIGRVEAISQDGGQTWTALPLLPEEGKIFPLSFSFGSSSAPDGTIYAGEVQTNYQGTKVGPDDLFALTPGAAIWVVVATMPQSDVVLTPVISATSDGHPNAMWVNLPGTSGFLYHAA